LALEEASMDAQKTVDELNRILSLEYAAIFQYLQHSYLVQGLEREYLRNFFREQAKEGMDKHTKWLGEKSQALSSKLLTPPRCSSKTWS
jgi:bacterioferritin (cytochrome b1)